MLINKDIIIVGAGPAGLAAAIEAKRRGIEDVLVLEREPAAGGILNQCIHDGFGLIRFNEALTGPEYARQFIDEAEAFKVDIVTNVIVQDITGDRVVTTVSPDGINTYKAGAVILAMGCRERTRGAICIPGTRPAGVYTAGVAQNLVNLKNIMVGKNILILGSGDIGLIMARRLTLEGANVIAVVEKLPYSSGLQRNITQCLEDFDIPLLLSHTVVKIKGHERVEGVTVAEVDKQGNIIRGTSREFKCDTLILSVGLIPENELSLNAGVNLDDITSGAKVDENLETSIPGIFACGNVLQVHDLVDYVSAEGELAARSAAAFIKTGNEHKALSIPVKAGKGIRYILPQAISPGKDITFSMRVVEPCRNKTVVFRDGTREIRKQNFKALNPAEMVRIDLHSDALKEVLELEVSIDEK